MAKWGRLTISILMTVLGLALVMYAFTSLMSQPSTLTFSAGASGQVNATLETVGSYGLGQHPTWVSYLIRSPDGSWQHTTIWQVPAHTIINVTIYQFDSGSPLRNQQLGQVTGTVGGTASLNGTRFSVIDSNVGNGVGHTFSIPSIGVSVPLAGNDGSANLCGVAPCEPSNTTYPHNTIKFSFMSPAAGNYPWQCFVPCAAGWFYGNGGPMSTVGYMGGFLKVA